MIISSKTIILYVLEDSRYTLNNVYVRANKETIKQTRNETNKQTTPSHYVEGRILPIEAPPAYFCLDYILYKRVGEVADIARRNASNLSALLAFNLFHVRFQVLTAASMMFRAVFWVVLPCRTIVDNHSKRQYNPEDSSEQTFFMLR
jgi:hypothetical protein